MNPIIISKGKVFEFRLKNTLIARCYLHETGRESRLLSNFIVYKRFRNQGFGTAFLSQLLNQINKNVLLYVKQDNLAAFRLYSKCGFKEIGSFEDKIVMFRNK